MAKYGANVLKVEFDNSANSLTDMSAYIETVNGFDVQAMLVESHSFGKSWVEMLFTGLRRVADITLGGFFDDAASTGPDVIFNDVGNLNSTSAGTRTLKFTWGGTKTSSLETWIKSYKRLPLRGDMTKFEVVLAGSGTVTEV